MYRTSGRPRGTGVDRYISPQELGLVWEILVRNYYVQEGYAAFRVAGSGPPCDIIAFTPPHDIAKHFPIRPFKRSPHLESRARKEYHEKFNYPKSLIVSLDNGFYLRDGKLISLQAHLIAFGEDHIRFIWARVRSRKRGSRIWDKKFNTVRPVEFIECKAVKGFTTEAFIRSKQYKRQRAEAVKAGALLTVIHKTDVGAKKYVHSPAGLVAIGYIIKWEKLIKMVSELYA